MQNITVVNQTGPRTYVYTFNPSVLNFKHGTSGTFLGSATSLNIILPNSSTLISVYPLPDSPMQLSNLTATATALSWYAGEPLYNYKLVFAVNESLMEEVATFFASIYAKLGVFSYLIIIAVILLFVLYTYLKARSWGS